MSTEASTEGRNLQPMTPNHHDHIAILHVSHLRESGSAQTVCGEPWQAWQQPRELDAPAVIVSPPKRGEDVRFCEGCRRVAQLLDERRAAGLSSGSPKP